MSTDLHGDGVHGAGRLAAGPPAGDPAASGPPAGGLRASGVALRAPGFGATLASEWTKLISLRSARVTLVLGTVLGIGSTALLAWAVLATWHEWSAEDRAAFNPIETSLIGTILTGTLFTVLGVTAVSSEYGSRMASLTFTATPRRERVLLAKAVVVAAVTFVASLVAVGGMVLVTRVIFAGEDVPVADTGTVLRVVLGIAAGAPLFPVIAVALTFVLRSAAGSVAALLGLLFGPYVLAPFLPSWWEDHAQRWLPGAASDSLTLPHFADSPEGLSRWLAALVVAGWLTAFLGAALAVLDRRDV
jgi:ABC-2 type transport system permease protein